MSSILNYINYIASLNLREEHIFLAANMLEFRYDSLNWIVLSPESINEINKSLGINIHWAHFENAGQVLSAIEGSINNGVPVIVSANTKYLDYSKMFTNYTGRAHLITVYGIDHSCDKIYISDARVINSENGYYNGTLSKTRFLQAIKEAKNKILIFAGLENIKQPDYKTAFFSCIESYLYPRSDVLGKNAVSLFFKSFAELAFVKEEQLSHLCREIVYGMKVMDFLGARCLLRKGMDYLLSNSISKEFAENYDRIINRYNRIALFITKLGVTQNRALIVKLQNDINILFNDELLFMEELLKLKDDVYYLPEAETYEK